MGMFGRGGETVVTTFAADDKMSPVVKGIRKTMDGFKKDAAQGFGLAAGINVWGTAQRAIGAVVDAIGDSTQAYREDQLSQVQLRASLEANIDAWDGNTKAIEDVIAARMDLGFSDDEQRASLALLVAQVKDVNDALAIQRTAMDLARLRGTTLAESATLLAKAYNGSATGLQRMGIQVSKGARGMDALAEVQKRVAGQAESYAEESIGRMDVLNVKIGELQERFGELISGPAADFVTFLSDVADSFTPHNAAVQEGIDWINRYGQAVETAAGQGEKLVSELEAEAVAKYAQEWRDYLDVNMDVINQQDQTGQSLQMLRDLNIDFARATGQSVDALTVLALRVQAMGGDYDDLVLAMQQMMASGIDLKAMGMRYVRTFDGMDEATGEATQTMRAFASETPTLMTRAVIDMRETIKSGKQEIIEQFRDLAWQSKHPFAEVRYAKWLEGKEQQALRRMKRANDRGMPGLAAQHRQLAADIRAEYQGLPGYMATIAGQAIGALSIIPGFGGLDDAFNWTMPAAPKKNKNKNKNKNRNNGNQRPGDGPPTGHNAMGGSVDAGGTYLVGENGPELLHMGGGGGGSITPNHRMSQPINVYVDGRRLFQINDTRNGRAIAMGG